MMPYAKTTTSSKVAGEASESMRAASVKVVTYQDNLAMNQKKSDVDPEQMMKDPEKGDLTYATANAMRFTISKTLA
jgi:hypothetical protein